MPPLSDVTAHAVQAEPTQLEIDVEEQMNLASPDWWMVIVPIIVAVIAVVQKWTPSKSDHLTAITQAYKDQVATSATQIRTLTEQDAKTQLRLQELERRVSKSDRRGDISERIAYKALDRVDDHQTYLRVREAARDINDPDRTITEWVPKAPEHLLDETWTAKHRAALDSLED